MNAASEPQKQRAGTDPYRSIGVPLTRLLADARLGLSVITAAQDLSEIALSQCAVVELEHPGEFLSGRELVLITGMGLPADPTDYPGYVAELRDAGIAALGFGIEPVLAEVPAALIDACDRIGVVLLRVPAKTLFVEITSAFARELESVRLRGLHALATLARRLTRAVLDPHPDRALIEVLAAHTDARVLLRTGSETLAAGRRPPGLDAAAEDRVLDAVERRLEHIRDDRELVFPAETGNCDAMARRIDREDRRTAREAVILVLKPHIHSDDRAGFALAADLLQAAQDLPHAQSLALDQLMMQLLVDGVAAPRPDQDRYPGLLAAALGNDNPRPVHAIIAISTTGRAAQATDLSWWRRAMATPLVDQHSGQLRAIAADIPSAETRQHLRERGWITCISAGYPAEDLATAMREAALLVPRARELGRSLSAGVDTGHFEELIPARLTALFAQSVLANIIAEDDAAELLHILDGWLRHHGAWDATARDLTVHRNTVRRLVQRCGRLLGRDLDDADVRAELIFALRYRRGDRILARPGI